MKDLKENISWMAKCTGWRWIIPITVVSVFCWIVAGIVRLFDWRKEKRAYKTYLKTKREVGMVNVLKKLLEERLGELSIEEKDCLYFPIIPGRIDIDALYFVIAEFINEIKYSFEETSVGDSSEDQRIELKTWNKYHCFRLKIYYTGNMMAIQFY